jgi:hypothetical protein
MWQTIKDVTGYESPFKPTAQKGMGDLLDVDAGQNLLTMVGTMGAGKSAHLSGLLIAADRKVSKTKGTEYPFRYFIDEGSANIENDKSALRAGHFPPKTLTMKASTVEPAATFEWAHVKYLAGRELTLSRRQSKMSIADMAGEDLVNLIEQVNKTRTLQQASQINVDRSINLVCNSSALMLIIKATRAQGLEIELEPEPTGIDGLSVYSDANLTRIVKGIVRFKRQNPNSPKLTHLAIVVTAWDGLAPVAKQISQLTGQPFDPLDTKMSADSLDKFVYAFYPSTHATIHSLGLSNIRYFPSFFEVERDSENKPVCWPGGNSPKIKRPEIFDRGRNWEDNVNTIKSSEYWFFKELDWLQELAN